MTKERLRAYRDLRREIEQIKHKVETLEAALYTPKIQRLTGMPSNPSPGNAMENLAARHLELLEHYRGKLDELAAEQLAIERAINSLPYREQTLLRYYYIDGLTWEEVCVRIDYSWRQTHRLHSKALERLKQQEEPEAYVPPSQG